MLNYKWAKVSSVNVVSYLITNWAKLIYTFSIYFWMYFPHSSGADPGGGPGGLGPPLTLGFEAPKLSIFGPYLIFP